MKQKQKKLKKSNAEFVDELYHKNPLVTPLEKYNGCSCKIHVMCNLCGNVWESDPNNLLRPRGCPECKKRKLREINVKSNETFIGELSRVNRFTEPIEPYITAKAKIKVRCKRCGYEWKSRPHDLLYGRGCPKCAGNMRRTIEQFRNELRKINQQIEVIDDLYVNDCTKLRVRCLKPDCKYEWSATPHDLLDGNGCPRCRESKGERAVSALLHRHHIEFVRQYKFDECRRVQPLPFDFYCPSYNAAIEYDGIQHFCEKVYFGGFDGLKYRQENDRIKSEFCSANGIKLIRIRYDDDIEKVLGEALGW